MAESGASGSASIVRWLKGEYQRREEEAKLWLNGGVQNDAEADPVAAPLLTRRQAQAPVDSGKMFTLVIKEGRFDTMEMMFATAALLEKRIPFRIALVSSGESQDGHSPKAEHIDIFEVEGRYQYRLKKQVTLNGTDGETFDESEDDDESEYEEEEDAPTIGLTDVAFREVAVELERHSDPGMGLGLFGERGLNGVDVEQWRMREHESFRPALRGVVNAVARRFPAILTEKQQNGLQPYDFRSASDPIPALAFHVLLLMHDMTLSSSRYLAGDFFSLADLCYMPALHWALNIHGYDLWTPASVDGTAVPEAFPALRAWWERVSARPAWRRCVAASTTNNLQSFMDAVQGATPAMPRSMSANKDAALESGASLLVGRDCHADLLSPQYSPSQNDCEVAGQAVAHAYARAARLIGGPGSSAGGPRRHPRSIMVEGAILGAFGIRTLERSPLSVSTGVSNNAPMDIQNESDSSVTNGSGSSAALGHGSSMEQEGNNVSLGALAIEDCTPISTTDDAPDSDPFKSLSTFDMLERTAKGLALIAEKELNASPQSDSEIQQEAAQGEAAHGNPVVPSPTPGASAQGGTTSSSTSLSEIEQSSEVVIHLQRQRFGDTDVMLITTVLMEKMIRFKTVLMNTEELTEDMKAAVARQEVQVFSEGQLHIFLLTGSDGLQHIVEQLETRYGDRGTPLYGSTPENRACIEKWRNTKERLLTAAVLKTTFSNLKDSLPVSASPNVKEIGSDMHLNNFKATHGHADRSYGLQHVLLSVYEQQLSTTRYLAGDFFSFADLCHLYVMEWLFNKPSAYIFRQQMPHMTSPDSVLPNLKRWWEDISSRPSWKTCVEASRKSNVYSFQQVFNTHMDLHYADEPGIGPHHDQ